MSYINWNGETNEQKLARKKREEIELFEQAAQIRSARSAQSANGAAGAGGALTLPDFKTINGESILGIGDIVIPTTVSSRGTSIYSVTPLAGPFDTSDYNTLLGANAGANTNTQGLLCIGTGAGSMSSYSSPNFSTFLGYTAGADARNAIYSFFAGYSSGSNAPNAEYSVMIGKDTGTSSTGGAHSNFLGFEAGKQGDGISHSNFLGYRAGTRAWFTQHSNFFGTNAGYQATNSSNSNFFGEEAGMGASANNVNAFGKAAHKNGTLDGQTVFANVTLPSYTNRSAATTAITIANGAVAGNTYLYYNQTTFAIEGVRL